LGGPRDRLSDQRAGDALSFIWAVNEAVGVQRAETKKDLVP
jgi:hypothetical protein